MFTGPSPDVSRVLPARAVKIQLRWRSKLEEQMTYFAGQYVTAKWAPDLRPTSPARGWSAGLAGRQAALGESPTAEHPVNSSATHRAQDRRQLRQTSYQC